MGAAAGEAASPTLAEGAAEPVEAVLFDLGGVLLEIDFGRVFAHWAGAAGVPVARVADRFAFDAAYEAHEVGAIGATEYFESLRRTLGLTLTDRQWHDGWCAIFVGEMPGAAALLGELDGRVPMHVFSNTNAAHHAWWSVRHASLLAPLGRVICSHQLGLRKPEVAAFGAACERIGVAPGRVLFVDDSAVNVAGARDAGLQAHRVDSAEAIRRVLEATGLCGAGQDAAGRPGSGGAGPG